MFSRLRAAFERAEHEAAIERGIRIVRFESRRPLAVRQRLLRAVELVQDIGTVVPRLGVVRLQREDTGVTMRRVLAAPGIAQGVAEIELRHGKIGPERCGALVTGERLPVVPELVQDDAAIEVDFGKIGPQGERAIHAGQGLFMAFHRQQHAAARADRVNGGGIERGHLIEQAQGFLAAAALVSRRASMHGASKWFGLDCRMPRYRRAAA